MPYKHCLKCKLFWKCCCKCWWQKIIYIFKFKCMTIKIIRSLCAVTKILSVTHGNGVLWCQRAAVGGVHAREAPVHGALPPPLLLLSDPRSQTRLRQPPPPLPHTHHRRQELSGWQKRTTAGLLTSVCFSTPLFSNANRSHVCSRLKVARVCVCVCTLMKDRY